MRKREYCPTCASLRPMVNYMCSICGSPLRLRSFRRALPARQEPVPRDETARLHGWQGLSRLVERTRAIPA
jgi:hypothetical protein